MPDAIGRSTPWKNLRNDLAQHNFLENCRVGVTASITIQRRDVFLASNFAGLNLRGSGAAGSRYLSRQQKFWQPNGRLPRFSMSQGGGACHEHRRRQQRFVL
jgi:hypothetical protein